MFFLTAGRFYVIECVSYSWACPACISLFDILLLFSLPQQVQAMKGLQQAIDLLEALALLGLGDGLELAHQVFGGGGALVQLQGALHSLRLFR